MITLYSSSSLDDCAAWYEKNCNDEDRYFDIVATDDDGEQPTHFAVKEYTFEEVYFMNGGTY